ncbi:hypothetical protein LCGC14_1105830 [marine sediment metagenome]|uniref:Uncharacterized protein n=1 Tax=marine sediment metagenome TaxID=412755 RepID=A0A0F9MW40_9ZZZZ
MVLDLFRALDTLRLMANQTYWENKVSCGSWFRALTCPSCEHFSFCSMDSNLKDNIAALK